MARAVRAPGVSRKASFAPLVDAHTQVVILGSLPGAQSLAMGRYYANPRNQVWRLLGEVIGEPPAPDYAARLATLRRHGIGLWDVVASAERSGSLDSAIRLAAANPLGEVLGALPNLKAIAFNGGAAARLGRRVLPPGWAIDILDLPSSSPAYTLAFAQKARAWSVLAQYLIAAGAPSSL